MKNALGVIGIALMMLLAGIYTGCIPLYIMAGFNAVVATVMIMLNKYYFIRKDAFKDKQ